MKQTINKQKGFTLIELMVVIVIIGVLSAYAASYQKRDIDKQVSSIAAEHLSKIAKASNAYIRDNYSAIMSLATSTQPAIIRVSDLISQNYLPPGTSTNNAYQQSTCALVLQPTPGQLTGMVVTEGGKSLDDFTLSSMVTKVGAAGGGIYTDTPAAIIGSRGGWSVSHANYSNANHLGQDCSGNAGTVDMDIGHAHVALWFENNDLTAGFLYREAIPARPELNRMATNLDMDTFDINNAGDIDGVSLTTTGKVDAQDGFDVDGTSVIDSSRNLVNIAAITASGKIDTSGTMEANTFSVNGTSVINSSRNLVNIGSISASSTISTSGSIRPGTATEGSACTTTGDIRRDSSGMLLSCQGGSWRTNSSSAIDLFMDTASIFADEVKDDSFNPRFDCDTSLTHALYACSKVNITCSSCSWPTYPDCPIGYLSYSTAQIKTDQRYRSRTCIRDM